jgi:predicted CXXCH cytochrome family protein
VPLAQHRFLWIAAGGLVLALVATAADWFSALPEGITPRYVGRQSCLACHAEQGQRWTGSDHDLAMDLATPLTVLGNFDDQKLTHFGITSRMFREGERYFVTTEGPTGKLETFPIKYTFGVRPLQQYMVEFPDGRVQVLSIAWDTAGKRWFDLHPDERIPPDDWLHWTKAGQNWNYMCAECHSTNVAKNYDLKTDTYHTTFSEIDVSCEACHGPGSLHIELANAKSLFWDRRYGYGLPELKGKSSHAELQVCARCHSRRRIVHGDYRPGREFLDYYEPEVLDGDLYYPDGQILEEVYEHGSFLQSRMHREGVRCTDCHDAHSTRLRLPGNQLCTRCHVAGKYDGPTHHHHPLGTKGTQCVECHMPTRTYMVVDPRRDHSLRVPRPDLTVELGTPNACQSCHAKKTPEWARDAVIAWYGPTRRQEPGYAAAIAAGRAGKPDGEPALVKLARSKTSPDQSKNVPAIVRASAVALLGRYSSAAGQEAIETALGDGEPLVRVAAVRQVDRQPQLSDAEAARLRHLLVPMLADRVRLVRTEAARVLSRVGPEQLTTAELSQLNAVLDEWRAGLEATIDDAGAHLAFGMVDANQGHVEPARDEYRIAMRLHPTPLQAVQARVQLGHLENEQGHNGEAERLFREIIQLEPKWDEGHFSLGLLLAEDEGRLAEAADALGKAVELSPAQPRMQYNYGLALQKLGRPREAEGALSAAVRLEPQSTEFLYALTLLYAQEQRWDRALECGQRLVRLDPRRSEFFAGLKRQAARPPRAGPERPK